MCIFRKPYTIDKLKALATPSIGQLKSATPILFVDDEDFAIINRLKDLEYKIDRVHDLEYVPLVADYPIVISDISGVGKKFSSDAEGAFVLKQIQTRYPMKVVGVYSASMMNPVTAQLSQGAAVFAKDADLSEWQEKLDNMIRQVNNPIEAWKRLRRVYEDANISRKGIDTLESKYVKYVLGIKDKKSLSPYSEGLSTEDVNHLLSVASSMMGIMANIAKILMI